jgi:phosphatidate phosphatase
MARTVKLSKRRQRCLQSLTHASTVALVSIAFLLIYLLVSPFERGFYCTDETIRYPYKPDTVPLWVAGAYGVISAILIVLLTEFHLYAPCCSSKKSSGKSFLKNSAYLMLTSGRGIFIYALGAASTLLITEIGKHTIGRLRPHFIDVCKPDWSRIQCFTKQNDGALPK